MWACYIDSRRTLLTTDGSVSPWPGLVYTVRRTCISRSATPVWCLLNLLFSRILTSWLIVVGRTYFEPCRSKEALHTEPTPVRQLAQQQREPQAGHPRGYMTSTIWRTFQDISSLCTLGGHKGVTIAESLTLKNHRF